MDKKDIVCFSQGNPIRMLDELTYRLMEYDHLIISRRKVACMLETRNVRLRIITREEQLRGRRFDEIFGLPFDYSYIYRKNPKSKPFTGSLINYILREEGLINTKEIYY